MPRALHPQHARLVLTRVTVRVIAGVLPVRLLDYFGGIEIVKGRKVSA